MLWAWFCETWAAWRSALCIVKPDTVPPVLDMEGPARAARAPINLQGDPETGSEDEPRQKWTNGRSSGTQSQPADAEEVVRLREAGRLAREARLAAHRGLE